MTAKQALRYNIGVYKYLFVYIYIQHYQLTKETARKRKHNEIESDKEEEKAIIRLTAPPPSPKFYQSSPCYSPTSPPESTFSSPNISPRDSDYSDIDNNSDSDTYSVFLSDSENENDCQNENNESLEIIKIINNKIQQLFANMHVGVFKISEDNDNYDIHMKIRKTQ